VLELICAWRLENYVIDDNKGKISIAVYKKHCFKIPTIKTKKKKRKRKEKKKKSVQPKSKKKVRFSGGDY